MIEIEPGLYLSNYERAQAWDYQPDRHYTIFNCTRDLDHIHGDNIKNRRLPIDDYLCDETVNELIFYIPQYVRTIWDDLQQGKVVIVHCRMGMSRSATLVAAYLIWRYRMTVDEAIALVREKSPQSFMFVHFRCVLESFVECFGGK